MDVGEDDFGLIHSKFRKAQKVVSRLSTEPSQLSSTSSSSIPPPPTPESSISSSVDQHQQHQQQYQQQDQTSLFSPTHSSAHHHLHLHPTTITRSVSFEEHMHVESILHQAPPSFTSTPSRLDTTTVITTSILPPRTSVLPKSPIFGTNSNNNNICFGGSLASSSSSSLSTHYQHHSINRMPSSGVGGTTTNLSSTSSSSASSSSSHNFPCEVFRFDSTDRERYLCSAISEEEEVFSPGPSPCLSLSSNYDSPQIVLDSPRITISPLRIQDSPLPTPRTPTAPLTPSPKMDSQNRLMAATRVGGHPSLAMLPPSASISLEQGRCLFGVPSSPVSPLTPNTPLSPSPLFNVDQQTFQQGFLAELYRRRCHSDSDLPLLPDSHSPKVEPTDLSMKSMGPTSQPNMHPLRTRKQIPHPLTIPCKGGSLESEQSSPQDSPLDLSVKGSRERFSSSTSCESLTTTRYISSLAVQQHPSPIHSPGVSVIRGDIASPTTRNSVALRYNLEVSPVVEEMPPGSDLAFVCPVCGQMFSLHDRLAKHMASRHKSKPHDPNKSYPCEICHRSFARSDMLTRHVRLHTGIKPYTCRVCGQVFSRSDHLSTHQRTHTGEKPYKCPSCPYSACRRDMITRHLRTHTRNSSSSTSSLSDQMSGAGGIPTTPTSLMSDFSSIDDRHSIKVECSRPPSSNSSFAPDSPNSPALHISSLSVNSPSPT